MAMKSGWEFHGTIVSNHGMHQAKENTSGDLLQCKLHHDRTIVTAPGLRCRFLSPMNHPDRLFRIVSGTPATDTYRFAMDFPFLATGPDALRGIERSSPIAQVIPFRRDAADGEADIPPETPYQQKNPVRVSRWRAVFPWSRRSAAKTGCAPQSLNNWRSTATVMTARWPGRSPAGSKPKSSTAAASSPSETSHPPTLRQTTMPLWQPKPEST